MALEQELEQELEQAILEICARAASENRISLVSLRNGTNNARALASRLLERQGQTSPGFRQLTQAGRFDLTFEALVLQARFRPLFSRAERVEARARLIDAIVTALNAAARGRPIGDLQTARAMRRGQQQVTALFGGENVRRNEGYAYHIGGNDELQFHIALVGFGRQPWLRYGVGFDLSRQQGESAIQTLAPKLERFNEFLRAHPERFAHLQIQHHRHGDVHTFEPGPLPHHFLRPPAFVFLGIHLPFEELSIDRVVDLFDEFMPLYQYVEAAMDMPPPGSSNGPPGARALTQPERSTEQRLAVDRTLRRRVLRAALIAHLEAQHGAGHVLHAQDSAADPDATVHGDDGVSFYGISTALTVRGCLREVLGRLLEGALASHLPQPAQLVVIGEAEADANDHAYLERLQALLSVAVHYRQIDLTADRLH